MSKPLKPSEKPVSITIRFRPLELKLIRQAVTKSAGMSFNRFVVNSAVSWSDIKLKESKESKEGK